MTSLTSRTTAALVAATALAPGACLAATVTNITGAGIPQATGTAIDLSSLGEVNWAAWHVESATTNPSLAPYATRTGPGTTGAIGSLAPAGTSASVRGTDVVTTYLNTFTWTDGSAASPGKLTGGFGNNVNSLNNGVGFSITTLAPLAAGLSYQISVLAAAYNGQGTLTATATGSTPVNQLSMNAANSTRQSELFQFSYTPGAETDSLDFTFTLTTDGGGTSSHVTIQAVGISIIPEPSATAMLMGAAATGLFLRRRRI